MQYKLGLVLSGGGTRGFSHIGALRALEEYGLYPDIISGVSVGSIVGVLYAEGYGPEDILNIFLHHNIVSLSRPGWPREGLLKFSGLEKKFKKYIRSVTFEQLKKPLFVAATNLNKGSVEYFHSGTLLDKIIASSSIPLLYKPIKIGEHLYLDGAVMDNFPITPLKNKCERIIGINIMPHHPVSHFKNIRQVAYRILQLTVVSMNAGYITECDILIEPKELSGFGYLSSRKGLEMYHIGYQEAVKILQGKQNPSVGKFPDI